VTHIFNNNIKTKEEPCTEMCEALLVKAKAMKASKLLSKKQSQEQYGLYIELGLKGFFGKEIKFEYFLTQTIKLRKPIVNRINLCTFV